MPGRDRDAPQLRAVAPLVMLGATPQLVGPILLVSNGHKVIGLTSAELLRPLHGASLAVATKLDGSATIPVVSWSMGRYAGAGLVELGDQGELAKLGGLDGVVGVGGGGAGERGKLDEVDGLGDAGAPRERGKPGEVGGLGGSIADARDVVPLDISAVCASVDTRGAPAALATIAAAEPPGAGYVRRVIAVHVDADDGGGMSDTVKRLASPLEAAEAAVAVDGATLFAWFPPDPALGRPSEVLAVALAYPYRAGLVKPRDTPVIAELVGLDDLGRALLSVPAHESRSELVQVAGEIEDKAPADPLAGLDE